MSQMNSNDPRRPDRVQRYKPLPAGCIGSPSEDPTPDYMNLLSMLFSMCGLMVSGLNDSNNFLINLILLVRKIDEIKMVSMDCFVLFGYKVFFSYLFCSFYT